jgi:hypothetical protein
VAEAPADTIPRTHRIVDHSRDQLVGIAAGESTFEECRLRYGRTQERLARERKGRVTASRVGENERNWAPTADLLSELMRLEAVERKPLPSARKFIDSYREERYELTERGRALAEAAATGRSSYVDRIAEALIEGHPHLQRLLVAVESGPIVCPVVGEGDIQRGSPVGSGTVGWATWGAEMIGTGIGAAEVQRIIEGHLRRRFGRRPPEQPSNKAKAEATNDAFAVAGFTARDLALDATTIKTLLRWVNELLLADQSRYVPAFASRNVVWLAADLDCGKDGLPRPTRRGLAAHGAQVARALVEAYFSQAAAADSSLVEPYLPVHRVRAQAAFERGVMRALVDLVLARLIDGKYPELGVTAFAHIGTRSAWPGSEPPFRYQDRRRLELTISKNSGEKE